MKKKKDVFDVLTGTDEQAKQDLDKEWTEDLLHGPKIVDELSYVPEPKPGDKKVITLPNGRQVTLVCYLLEHKAIGWRKE